jgi:hypothetical protein
LPKGADISRMSVTFFLNIWAHTMNISMVTSQVNVVNPVGLDLPT